MLVTLQPNILPIAGDRIWNSLNSKKGLDFSKAFGGLDSQLRLIGGARTRNPPDPELGQVF